MGRYKIGLQWSINRKIPSSKRFKSRRGCGFQTQGLDSADDNERWDIVGFCKNACMHVWGHVKLGCNGVLIETFPLDKRRGCGFQTQGLDLVDDNERWDSVGFCKNACMHVWGHVYWVAIEYYRNVPSSNGIKNRRGGVLYRKNVSVHTFYY